MSDGAPSGMAPRRGLVIVLACLAIAGLAFAIGRFSAFGSARVTPTTASAEAGYSRDMQVHHAQAIEMAMEIYRKTDDEQVRAVSYDIATSQAGQRGEMFDWLVQWALPQSGGPMMAWMSASPNGHAHGGGNGEELTEDEARTAMGMASDAELNALADASGTAADCMFLELMIRHHGGAIPMADAVLELGSEPRVRQVAAASRSAQAAEIESMQSMQQRLGCAG